MQRGVPLFKTHQADDFWTAEVNLAQINSQIAAEFQNAFSEAVVQHHGPVILDLKNVSFIDSSGLAAIVFCFKSLALRDELVLCSLGDRLRKVLDATHIDKILRIYPNLDEAMAALTESPDDD